MEFLLKYFVYRTSALSLNFFKKFHYASFGSASQNISDDSCRTFFKTI